MSLFYVAKLYYQFMNELAIVCIILYLFTHATHLTCLPMPCILPVYPCTASYLFTHALHRNCLPIQSMLPVYPCSVASLFIQTMHPACYVVFISMPYISLFNQCTREVISMLLVGGWINLVYTQWLMSSRSTNAQFSRYQLIPNFAIYSNA